MICTPRAVHRTDPRTVLHRSEAETKNAPEDPSGCSGAFAFLSVQTDGVDLVQLFLRERSVLNALDVAQKLLRTGGSYQNTGHDPIPQDPAQSHLCQALSAPGSQIVECADLVQTLFGQDGFFQETSVGYHAAVFGNAVEIPVGEQALCQRGKCNDTFL